MKFAAIGYHAWPMWMTIWLMIIILIWIFGVKIFINFYLTCLHSKLGYETTVFRKNKARKKDSLAFNIIIMMKIWIKFHNVVLSNLVLSHRSCMVPYRSNAIFRPAHDFLRMHGHLCTHARSVHRVRVTARACANTYGYVNTHACAFSWAIWLV